MQNLPNAMVFTRQHLRACGWSDAAITRAVRSRRLIQVRRGLLCRPAADRPITAAIAATAACRGATMSHLSALLVRGLPIVCSGAPPPELTVGPRGTGQLAGARLHRARLTEADVTVLCGIRITSVARTLIDVARSRSTACAVAAIDAALHDRLVTVAELDAVVLDCWNWPGIRRAHRALALADGRAESPLESVSRLVIGWLGLPPPHLQARVVTQDGWVIARTDFYWDEFGVAGEADGRSKYDARDVLTAEKDRQERIEDLGVVATRWGWQLATRRPQALRAKLLNAFERGTLLDRSGHRRRWSARYAAPIR